MNLNISAVFLNNGVSHLLLLMRHIPIFPEISYRLVLVYYCTMLSVTLNEWGCQARLGSPVDAGATALVKVVIRMLGGNRLVE
jgi:hypothetical protein